MYRVIIVTYRDCETQTYIEDHETMREALKVIREWPSEGFEVQQATITKLS